VSRGQGAGTRGQAGCPRWIKFLEETVGSREIVQIIRDLTTKLLGVACPEGNKEGTQKKGAVQCRNPF
jgi:hypothetical protein